MLHQRLTAIFPTDLSALPWLLDAALWWAVGGTVAAGVLLDLTVAISWLQRVLAVLLQEIIGGID
jgi:hypothetical protein